MDYLFKQFRYVVPFAVMGLLLAGCIFRTVEQQQEKFKAYCMLSGQVRSDQPDSAHPMVVVLARHHGGDINQPENWDIADHFVLDGPGRWFFMEEPGTYGFAAFEDANGDLVYEPGESALRVDENHLAACRAGETKPDINLAIPKGGKPRLEGNLDIRKLQVRSFDTQLQLSMAQVMVAGELASLGDPRFSHENAKMGLWRPFDFMFEAHPGVYFLQPYDPNKIPVLFVHGITGTPLEFQYLIEHLDSKRFQPWVAYYPSGVSLGRVADFYAQLIEKLRFAHGFKRMVLIAHSMGGLVSRDLLLKLHAQHARFDIPLFVTLSTPWNGHKAAEMGVEHAPVVVKSWYDMAPGSPFLRGLFYDGETRRSIPGKTRHYLLFGFNRSGILSGPSDDGTVTVASQLRWEAQSEATNIYGFDDTHTGILDDPKVSTLLNRILQQVLGR